MARIPQYQSRVGLSVPGEEDTWSGDAAKASVEGNIVGQADKYLHHQLDSMEQQKGTADAMKQGGKTKSDWDGTEAGRAYNSSAMPLAATMAQTDLSSQYEQMYNTELINGVGPASMASLQGQMKVAAQETVQNVDPKIQKQVAQSSVALANS